MNREKQLSDLVAFVRKHSPFYRKLYERLPASIHRIEELPLLDQEEFWKACCFKDNQVLTGPMRDGIVFRSGGTTGNPKFSVFSRDEWEEFNEAFGRGIGSGGIAATDRVANLFYVGQLYGSFLFITKSLEKCPHAVLQFPVSGITSIAETADVMRDFSVNVVAGVPTTIMNLAEHIAATRKAAGEYRWEKVLFGGEAMYPDQRERLSELFPGIKILSIGYASTDGGLLGYADASCGPGEHRSYTKETIFELIDEGTGKPIEEEGQEGLIVMTNLTRRLMPILRFPVGDRGKWVEPPGTPDRRFALLGRSEEAARVGLVKLYVQDVQDVLEPFKARLGLAGFQLVIVHRELLDGLILRIAARADGAARKDAESAIIEEIHRARPLYAEFVRDHKVHPIEIEWVASCEQLEINARTGKMKRVIDRRDQ